MRIDRRGSCLDDRYEPGRGQPFAVWEQAPPTSSPFSEGNLDDVLERMRVPAYLLDPEGEPDTM